MDTDLNRYIQPVTQLLPVVQKRNVMGYGHLHDSFKTIETEIFANLSQFSLNESPDKLRLNKNRN